jgi:hypothetical protein
MQLWVMSKDHRLIKYITIELAELSLADQSKQAQTEEALIEAIESRVNELLEKDPGLLFSYLYRLDVSETKVAAALKGLLDTSPVQAIARLIYDRQMVRVKTKLDYKQDPIDGWEW